MQTLRAGSYRPRSTTITTLGEAVDWNRRGLDERRANMGRTRQVQDISRAVYSGMGACGMSGLGGLGGACSSSGAQVAQSLIGATGTILSMYGASSAASAKPETFSTDDGSKEVLNISSRATNLSTAGSIMTSVGDSWAAACRARAEARAGDTINMGPPPALPPPTAAPSTWIPGVSNGVVLAGAAVAVVGAALMLRG